MHKNEKKTKTKQKNSCEKFKPNNYLDSIYSIHQLHLTHSQFFSPNHISYFFLPSINAFFFSEHFFFFSNTFMETAYVLKYNKDAFQGVVK